MKSKSMKLLPLIEQDEMPTKDISEPAQVNTYNMKYVNGGFSNSVEVQPGVGENLGKVFIGINIFGGGDNQKVSVPTPPKVKQLLQAYQVAVHKQDPSADKIKKQLESYYAELKQVIAADFVGLMKQLDLKAKQAISKSIQSVNGKFQ